MKFLQNVLIISVLLFVLSFFPEEASSQVDSTLTNQLSTSALRQLGGNYVFVFSKTEPCNCKGTDKDPPCKGDPCKTPEGGVYTKLDRESIFEFDSLGYNENIDSLNAIIFRISKKIVELRIREISGTKTTSEETDQQILELILFEYKFMLRQN